MEPLGQPEPTISDPIPLQWAQCVDALMQLPPGVDFKIVCALAEEFQVSVTEACCEDKEVSGQWIAVPEAQKPHYQQQADKLDKIMGSLRLDASFIGAVFITFVLAAMSVNLWISGNISREIAVISSTTFLISSVSYLGIRIDGRLEYYLW